MSKSPFFRFPLAGISILIAWMLIDALAHRLFLAHLYTSTPGFWRSFDEMNIPLIYAVTLGLIVIFLAIYWLLVKPKSPHAGLLLGLFLGLALGGSVGFGTFIHAQIPVALAWGWFIAGTVKGLAAGAIIGVLITES